MDGQSKAQCRQSVQTVTERCTCVGDEQRAESGGDVPVAEQPRRDLVVGETVILLHPPVPLIGVSIRMERGCQQENSLADGLCDRPAARRRRVVILAHVLVHRRSRHMFLIFVSKLY